MFGNKPRHYASPLESGDHPEIDTSKERSTSDINKHQSLIGQLQWGVSLGRFDINTTIMKMLSLQTSRKQGHLKRLQRMYEYLSKFSEYAMKIRTEEPDYSGISIKQYEWEKSIYGNVKELIRKEVPQLLGKTCDINQVHRRKSISRYDHRPFCYRNPSSDK